MAVRSVIAYTHVLLLPDNRVSSVLNRNSKQYGKKFMFDGQEETCWNSDQVGLMYAMSLF